MLILTLALGCMDTQVTPNYPPPEVAILAPVDGATVLEGTELLLTGTVMDLEDGLDQLDLSWSSSLEGVFTGEFVIDGDTVTLALPSGLQAGEHLLQLTATDSSGGSGTDDVLLTAVENTPPQVSIVSPAADGQVSSFAPLTLVASVSDEHSRAEDMIGIWTSSLDGELQGEASVSGATVSLALDDGLSPGTHQLAYQAIDELGAVGVDQITVEAWENQPPQVTFVLPQEGTHYEDHSTVVVQLQITDDEDRGDDLALSWSGLTDMSWCTGDLPLEGTGSGLVTATLRIECNHYYGVSDFVLAVSATDSTGATGQDMVVISGTCPP